MAVGPGLPLIVLSLLLVAGRARRLQRPHRLLLLHQEEPGFGSLILFASVMGVHFVVNDFGLREDHEASYDRVGRWALAAAF